MADSRRGCQHQARSNQPIAENQRLKTAWFAMLASPYCCWRTKSYRILLIHIILVNQPPATKKLFTTISWLPVTINNPQPPSTMFFLSIVFQSKHGIDNPQPPSTILNQPILCVCVSNRRWLKHSWLCHAFRRGTPRRRRVCKTTMGPSHGSESRRITTWGLVDWVWLKMVDSSSMVDYGWFMVDYGWVD